MLRSEETFQMKSSQRDINPFKYVLLYTSNDDTT